MKVHSKNVLSPGIEVSVKIWGAFLFRIFTYWYIPAIILFNIVSIFIIDNSEEIHLQKDMLSPEVVLFLSLVVFLVFYVVISQHFINRHFDIFIFNRGAAKLFRLWLYNKETDEIEDHKIRFFLPLSAFTILPGLIISLLFLFTGDMLTNVSHEVIYATIVTGLVLISTFVSTWYMLTSGVGKYKLVMENEKVKTVPLTNINEDQILPKVTFSRRRAWLNIELRTFMFIATYMLTLMTFLQLKGKGFNFLADVIYTGLPFIVLVYILYHVFLIEKWSRFYYIIPISAISKGEVEVTFTLLLMIVVTKLFKLLISISIPIVTLFLLALYFDNSKVDILFGALIGIIALWNSYRIYNKIINHAYGSVRLLLYMPEEKVV